MYMFLYIKHTYNNTNTNSDIQYANAESITYEMFFHKFIQVSFHSKMHVT